MSKVAIDEVDHDMVGSQAIHQYLGAIRNIFDIQKRQGLLKIKKSSLMTDRVKDLIKLVGKRKERVMKSLHKERLDGEFQPSQLVGEIPKIEAELWNVSSIKERGRWYTSCFMNIVNYLTLFFCNILLLKDVMFFFNAHYHRLIYG